MDPAITSLSLNLTATGIAAGTGVAVGGVRDTIRRNMYDEDLEHVATVFADALKETIEAENARRDTNELAGATDDWQAVLAEVAEMTAGEASDGRSRERDQVGHLFRNEEDAAVQIAEAIATVQGFDLSKTPQLREELVSAVGDAYAEAVAEFERRIAGTDLGDVFQQELQLDIREAVEDIQHRLDELKDETKRLLVQDARNEGFDRLSESYFAYGPDPKPVQCWQIGFSLTDVRAGLPAERDGNESGKLASEELYEQLCDGTDSIIVGRPGSGKSTLCKQVAIRWYDDEDNGPVFYRESGSGGQSFRSTDALQAAITATDEHVLVVVEDAVRPEAENVFETVESLSGYETVSFLFDARRAELDSFDETSIRGGARRRQQALAKQIHRYALGTLTKRDVERVIERFETATDREVPTDADSLYERVSGDSEYGVMLRLAYALPLGEAMTDGATEGTSDGIKQDVEVKFRRLQNPDRDGDTNPARDLSRFDADLTLRFGLLTQLLSAAGINLKEEHLHGLGYIHGDSDGFKIHDEIDELIEALEGWFLFRTDDGVRTAHELWAFLFLRHATTELRHRRIHRHVATCLDGVTAVFDNPDFRAHLTQVFLGDSDYLDDIESSPTAAANDFTEQIYALGKRYPVLAPLYGSATVSLFDIPDACDAQTAIRCRAWQGVMFIEAGDSEGARKCLEDALNRADRATESVPNVRAFCLTGLAVIARNEGNLDLSTERHREALALYEDRNDIVGQVGVHAGLALVARDCDEFDEAERHNRQALDLAESATDELASHSLTNVGTLFNNLGEIARLRGDIEQSRDALERGLVEKRELDDTYGAARSLWNLGELALLDGDLETAREYAERSRQEAAETGNRNAEARALACLAAVATREAVLEGRDESERRGDEGRRLAQRSLEIAREIDTQPVITTALTRLGRDHERTGENEVAARNFEEAAEIYCGAGASFRALSLLTATIEAHDACGNDDAVSEWCEQFADVLKSVERSVLSEIAVAPDLSTVEAIRERCSDK